MFIFLFVILGCEDSERIEFVNKFHLFFFRFNNNNILICLFYIVCVAQFLDKV